MRVSQLFSLLICLWNVPIVLSFVGGSLPRLAKPVEKASSSLFSSFGRDYGNGGSGRYSPYSDDDGYNRGYYNSPYNNYDYDRRTSWNSPYMDNGRNSHYFADGGSRLWDGRYGDDYNYGYSPMRNDYNGGGSRYYDRDYGYNSYNRMGRNEWYNDDPRYYSNRGGYSGSNDYGRRNYERVSLQDGESKLFKNRHPDAASFDKPRMSEDMLRRNYIDYPYRYRRGYSGNYGDRDSFYGSYYGDNGYRDDYLINE